MKRKYNKYTSVADRLPFIALIVILGLSILFLFIFSQRFPLSFFSGSASTETALETADLFNLYNKPFRMTRYLNLLMKMRVFLLK